MIASGVSSSAICLRCRLRLLRQSTRPLRQFSRIRYPVLRSFASDASARSFSLQNDTPEDREETKDSGNQGRGNFVVRRPAAQKRRLSKNRILTEDAEGLSSDMLGKPASVIVMRDGGLYRKKNPSMVRDGGTEDEPSSEPFDIEALLEHQREPPSPQEVRDNIDSLRPETETVLSGKEFRKLQAMLTDGFLSAQLNDYLQHHWQNGSPRKHQQVDIQPISKDDQAAKYEWIEEISPWVPLEGPSTIPEGSDPNLYGYIADSATPKEKLVMRILRECWGLSVVELDAGLGETRIRIRDREFILLILGTQRWVTDMGEIWLDPGERIETFRNQKTLRLVTTKTKAFTLVKDLDEMLKQITTKSFPINLTTTELLDEAMLEEVGRITNSHIDKSKTSDRLDVTWIELKKPTSRGPTNLEDTHDIVYRLLLTALYSKPRTTTSLYAETLGNTTNGQFVLGTTNQENIGWNNRMKQWARYMLPLTSENVGSATESPLKKLGLPIEPETDSSNLENKESIPDSDLPSLPIKWAEELKVSTKAQLGYLVHAKGPSSSPPPFPDLLTANHPRVLTPTTPHALQLAKLESNNEATRMPMRTKSTIIIHFWPSPPKALTYKPEAPILELRLAVSNGQVKGVESLRAIKQTQITDVMLPASPVDLRFTQTQFATLEGKSAELANWKPLADLLKPARLDLFRRKLEMPPRHGFPIPRRLHDNFRSGSADPDELVDTSYLFAGLEVHQSVSIPYEGLKLTYTSIDEDINGGRRAELNLEPGFGGGEIPDIGTGVNEHNGGFLATCYKLARDNALWS